MSIFVVPRDGTGPRFGVAATRRLGSAVVRNKAKRLARELFRRHKITAAADIVIVPRREMLDASFSSLETNYLALLARNEARRPSDQAGAGRKRRPAAAARV